MTTIQKSFVPPPSFSENGSILQQCIRISMELIDTIKFSRQTSSSAAMANIMQMLHCFVNNIHVDYAELLWEGLYYLLHHPTSSIPYPRFTKIIVSHYMTIFPDISRRVRDMYHNLQDDDIMRIFSTHGNTKQSWNADTSLEDHVKRSKQGIVGCMRRCLGIDGSLDSVTATELPTDSIGQTSALRITRLTPPAPVPTVDKGGWIDVYKIHYKLVLLSIKVLRNRKQEKMWQLVDEHLAYEEFEKDGGWTREYC
ncbi:hypothetical protein Tco_1070967 [Tanacetum coccineum]|uniref:Uncharacterized protein n=1 Tax=Tanacetum coccineum TaxID=301880 RepID=A0ABQ5HPP8_9ASTR